MMRSKVSRNFVLLAPPSCGEVSANKSANVGALIFIITLFGSVLIIVYHPPFVQRFLKVRFNFFEEGVTQVSFFVGCGELSQPTRKCKRLMRFQYAFVGTGNCHFISFWRKYIIKDALADGLPIEIQNIILKTQTAGCRIGTCTRIRFYLWCFAPCGRSRKHLCKFCICEINARFNFFLVSIQADFSQSVNDKFFKRSHRWEHRSRAVIS